MKVALLHSAFVEWGGAERLILNQAAYLRYSGHIIDCFGSIIDYNKYTHNFGDAMLRPYTFNAPLPFLRYSSTISTNLLLSPFICRRIKDYDIILCHHYPGPWIGYRAHKKYGIPFICYVHHPPLFLYPEYMAKGVEWAADFDRRIILHSANIPMLHSLLSDMDQVSMSEADAVVANSKLVARQIKRIYGRNTTVCYPGVDIDYFKPLPIESTDYVYGRFNIKHPFVLSVGRLVPRKRLDWLLQIAQRVRKEAQTTFVIAGQKSSHAFTLMKLVRKLGMEKDVKFVGGISDNDLRALYNECEVAVLTSPKEYFGLVPIEAMACGTPVIVWDDEGGPSETVMDEITGYKVKPYNLYDLALKIIKLLNNDKLRRKMSRNAVSHIREHFTWEKHASILEKVLNAVY